MGGNSNGTINSEHLKFLSRDLSGDEVISCEKIANQFLTTDNFEIEIHNLNEVNEYFRIFKDQILQLKSQLTAAKGQSVRQPAAEHEPFHTKPKPIIVREPLSERRLMPQNQMIPQSQLSQKSS